MPDRGDGLGDGFGDFFAGGGMPTCPDVSVKAVEEKVEEHLQRAGKGALTLADTGTTVKRTLQAICQHQ